MKTAEEVIETEFDLMENGHVQNGLSFLIKKSNGRFNTFKDMVEDNPNYVNMIMAPESYQVAFQNERGYRFRGFFDNYSMSIEYVYGQLIKQKKVIIHSNHFSPVSPFDKGYYQNCPTPVKTVREMILDLGDEVLDDITQTYYDGFCSDGSFIVELLRELITRFWDNGLYRSRFASREACAKYIIENMLFYWDKNPRRMIETKIRLDNVVKARHNRLKMDEAVAKKIKVWVGNPPYHKAGVKDRKGGQKTPIFHTHIMNAIDNGATIVCMITPSRWFASSGGLGSLRKTFLKGGKLKKINHIEDSTSLFPDVDIGGGVSYFVWDRNHNSALCKVNLSGKKEIRDVSLMDIFIPDEIGYNIASKVVTLSPSSMKDVVSVVSPFNIPTTERPENEGELFLQTSACSGPYPASKVSKGKELIDNWKLFLGQRTFEKRPDKNDTMRYLNSITIRGPRWVCNHSYLAVGPYSSELEASNAEVYLRTRFVRFLLRQTFCGTSVSRDNFCLVPNLPMTEEWTDEKLYKRYNLTEEEIAYIESKIRPMQACSKAA